MTDLFDTLRSSDDALAPDRYFRADLLSRLAVALADESAESYTSASAPPSPPTEILMLRQQPTRSRRSIITIGLAVVASAAVLVGIVLLTGDDPESPAPQDDITVPTTGAAPVSAEEVIAAGLLGASDIGDGYRLATDQDEVVTLDQETGHGASSPECAPFLDTVFESNDASAVADSRNFSTSGAGMQQYIVVFPDEAGAQQMMATVADPRFADCWAVVAFEAYTASDPPQLSARSRFDVVVPARSIEEVGDEMVVIELAGTFVLGGTTFEDRGPTVFLREGRAVTFLNPNSATTVTGQPGYPDAQLEQALATAADRLDAIQDT